MTASELDPAAIMAAHHPDHDHVCKEIELGNVEFGWYVASHQGASCETYRLAEALAAERARVQRVEAEKMALEALADRDKSIRPDAYTAYSLAARSIGRRSRWRHRGGAAVSAQVQWLIYCDVNGRGCWGGGSNAAEIGDVAVTAEQLRAKLRAAGWLCRGGRDVCPDCRPGDPR